MVVMTKDKAQRGFAVLALLAMMVLTGAGAAAAEHARAQAPTGRMSQTSAVLADGSGGGSVCDTTAGTTSSCLAPGNTNWG
jgi:hypothetical protein